MSRLYSAAVDDSPLFVLAHGAGAGHDHPWMKRVADGLAARGISVVTFDFPYKEKKRSAPDPPGVLEEAFASVWREAAVAHPRVMFAGGKSMGGRIASQAAARRLFDPAPAGLVFFGYPLHPPGKPQQRRDRHLPQVDAPMLFLHGTRDPFGTPDELTELVSSLPGSLLELLDGGDHSLTATKAQEAKSSRLDRAIEVAAVWMLNQASRPSDR